jgi:AcrR family transcriptional regulator
MSGSSATRRFAGGGGSGRDPQAHERILRATRDLLLESGYAGLTIEAVAARAGVGKPTIYRWWRNKAALVHEVVTLDTIETEPDTGDVAHDVEQWIRRVAGHLSRPEMVAALPGLLADLVRDRSVAEAVDRVSQPGIAHLRSIIESGQRTGDIPADTAPDRLAATVSWLVVGAVAMRGVGTDAHGEPCVGSEELAADLSALLLHGLLARP